MLFLWALAILVSFFGYGALLARVLPLRAAVSPFPWALVATWGMCLVVALGGVLVFFGVAFLPTILTLVLVGLGAFAVGVKEGWLRVSMRPSHREDWVLWLLVGLVFLASLGWMRQFDPNDDYVAYLVFPEKILQTGTLLEPFSLRRALVLGGHSFLQAMVLVVGDVRSSFAIDKGLGLVLFFGLLSSLTSGVTGVGARILRFLLLAFVVFLPVPRIHTGSHLMGSSVILALVMTLRLFWSCGLGWRFSPYVGLLVAGLASFRSSFAFLGPLLVVGVAVGSALSNRSWRPLGFLVLSGVFTLVFLGAWMGTQFLSSGNLMFPLSPGFASPEFIFGGVRGGFSEAALGFWSHLTQPRILVLLFPLLGLVFLPKEDRWFAAAVLVPVLLLTAISFWTMAGGGFYDVYRYVYPALVVGAFWILASLLSRISGTSKVFCLVGASLVFIGVVNWTVFRTEFVWTSTAARAVLSGKVSFPVIEGFAPIERELQRSVPVGEPILAVVDVPYGLMFSRNPIFIVDVPGGASPMVGGVRMPVSGDGEALRSYLLARGISWVMASSFDAAYMMYSRAYWKDNPRQEWYFREVWAPPILGFMAAVDELAAKYPTTKEGHSRLINLE